VLLIINATYKFVFVKMFVLFGVSFTILAMVVT